MGRLIRESMDAWRTVVVFVFSVSVCILSTRGSAGRQRAEDFLQRGGGNSAISDSPQPNEEDTVSASISPSPSSCFCFGCKKSVLIFFLWGVFGRNRMNE